MPTTTTGTFFVARQAPIAATEGDEFVLTLRLVDRQSPGCAEAYQVRWKGASARTWWDEHRAHLQPGTPLRVVLHNPRTFPGLRAPETHATVHTCELAPLAPSWQVHAARAGEQEPPRALPA
jgi:hypothetical protein